MRAIGGRRSGVARGSGWLLATALGANGNVGTRSRIARDAAAAEGPARLLYPLLVRASSVESWRGAAARTWAGLRGSTCAAVCVGESPLRSGLQTSTKARVGGCVVCVGVVGVAGAVGDALVGGAAVEADSGSDGESPVANCGLRRVGGCSLPEAAD